MARTAEELESFTASLTATFGAAGRDALIEQVLLDLNLLGRGELAALKASNGEQPLLLAVVAAGLADQAAVPRDEMRTCA